MNISFLRINFSNIFQLQNTLDLLITVPGTPQRDDLLVSPETISRFALFDRVQERDNFGLNNQNHLRYPGGFITVSDKINSKWSDFILTRTLTIAQSSFFNSGIDMADAQGGRTNRITNVRSIASFQNFIDGGLDNEALTIGDFKRYFFTPGMIMLWSGTYDSLVTNLPLWRLCAPPDSDKAFNGISVPNLQGRFVMGARYSQHGSYQTVDQSGVPLPNTTNVTINPTSQTTNIGGRNFVSLTLREIPSHRHNNSITLQGSNTTTTGNNVIFMEATEPISYSGNDVSASRGGWNVSRDGRSDHNVRRFASITAATRSALTLDSLTINNAPLVMNRLVRDVNGVERSYPLSITSNSTTGQYEGVSNPVAAEENRGLNELHENRPPFYAMAYIVYVGVDR
jgi:microcystin-dependent protein